MKPIKTLERRVILEHSKYLKVEEHRVEFPDGHIVDDWPWIITPDFINVVAITTTGEFICLKQMKYAADGISLAPVGGYLEPGEDSLGAAKRELLEETGYEAEEWIALGKYPVGANRGVATGYPFLARGAKRVAEPDADDLEEIEIVMLSRQEVEAALMRGEFKILSWAANVALALLAG